ncbi:hypothetical protein CesoFtcFv8_003424 [Champsocephalus esox]|uniref:Uncharacterized protein n=2 Tax=Champsocephalus TaxID=52236 RepID=A0AAN8HY59_CHAGU|nr:hypothetical protein CesoFtcFv8_003424 [Champsocephalus esox]KAK5932107.1 hypothetical protein CgunFtcFv8_003839 [Champsocephalus gunnari]
MIDMKKNRRHQELIIESSFPALLGPEKASICAGLVDVLLVAMVLLAQAAGRASLLPIALLLIEIRCSSVWNLDWE